MKNKQLNDYNSYRVELLNYSLNRRNTRTQEELIEWLRQLLNERNVYALQGVRDAYELHRPTGFKMNPIWTGEWNTDVADGVAKHFWNVVS